MTENNLPALAPPRLPWHPVFKDEFDIDETSWHSLVEGIFPAAQSINSIRLALSYCKARHLDPYKRVVHVVPVWSTSQGKYVETIWPGIAELRITAFRTGQYAGCDPTLFGENASGTWIERLSSGRERGEAREIEHELIYPSWAQVTVYRLDRTGTPRAVPGPRVMWGETYSRIGRSDCPNERWRRAPFQMIEKCAEAAALRRAFPEELGDQYTDDEAGGRAMVDVTPPAAAGPAAPSGAPTEKPDAGNAGLRERLAKHLDNEDRPSSPQNITKIVDDIDDVLGKSPRKPQEGAPRSDDVSQAAKPDGPPAGSAGAAATDPTPAEQAPASVSSPVAPVGGTATPPGSDFEVITPIKKGRSFDWEDYCQRYIAAGLQVPRENLSRWRGRQAAMFEGLHQSLPQAWSKANQCLAYYERTGLLPTADGEVPE